MYGELIVDDKTRYTGGYPTGALPVGEWPLSDVMIITHVRSASPQYLYLAEFAPVIAALSIEHTCIYTCVSRT